MNVLCDICKNKNDRCYVSKNSTCNMYEPIKQTQEDNNDYNNFLKMIQNAKIKHRIVDGDFKNTLDDNHYIVFEGGCEPTIMSAQFNSEYKLVDIYFANACQKLEDF